MDRAQLLNDPEVATHIALEGNQAGVWTALPCIVSSVDFTKMTLTAQPSIQGVTENEDGSTNYVNLPLLVDVPICFPSAGGFMLTLPLKSGDEVLVIFSSRCIDSWWQNGGIGVPMETRMHDLSDGFALPGPRSLPKLPGGSISTTAAQLRNDSGTVYLEISASGVNVVGNLNVTGTITSTGEVTGNGIPLSIHLHGGVQNGGGTTSVPIP